jgi:hypothetical protein
MKSFSNGNGPGAHGQPGPYDRPLGCPLNWPDSWDDCLPAVV